MSEVFVVPTLSAKTSASRVMRHAEVSRARYKQISPKMRGVLESYQNGIRQFMAEHPEQVPSWASAEVRARRRSMLRAYIIWNWPVGEAAGRPERAGLSFDQLPLPGLANEMLIAPRHTTMNELRSRSSTPMCTGTMHMRFYEVRIYTPELSVAGVSILGAPIPDPGPYSRFCSVAMTNRRSGYVRYL